MSILQEFKEFAVKGNVMDLAVGVIIGGAFSKITTSLVEDVIMPVISAIMGTAMTYEALKAAGVPVLAYGNFITIVINFIILAFIVFMLVKGMNKMRKQAEAEPEAPAEPSEEVLLLREISAKLSK